jgi:hypothetical protein
VLLLLHLFGFGLDRAPEAESRLLHAVDVLVVLGKHRPLHALVARRELLVVVPRVIPLLNLELVVLLRALVLSHVDIL